MARIPHNQRKDWYNRNSRLNQDVELTPGVSIRDADGVEGTVTSINVFQDDPDGDGVITICTLGGDEEHYSIHGWKSFLRIVS